MITEDAHATETFGREWAKTLLPGTVVALHGDLGAGKTTLVKGIVSELTGTPPQQISSPTFTLMHLYESKYPVYHFDLYRLKSAEEFVHSGFTDFFDSVGICLIEWPDRITPILPKNTVHIHLTHLEQGGRQIDV